MFEEGSGFDGSSIRGWQPIHASDMLVMPDPTTAVMDPFTDEPTLSLICNIVDPITKEDYTRDPRNIARKAEAYLQSTGVGDVAYFGPEPEFFILDDIRYGQNQHEGFYFLDSAEGQWNTGREEHPNLGYKPRYKEGYFPVPPTDSQQDIRTEMMPHDGGGGAAGGEAAPRGGDGGAGGDRPALSAVGEDGRRAACGTSTSARTWRGGTARR